MMTAAEAAEAAKGSTFEMVWAAIIETDKRIDKLGDKVEKIGDKVEKLSDKVEKLSDKVEKLSDKVDVFVDKVDKLGDKVEKLSDKVDKMADNMGGLNRKFGELAEYLVAPGIVRCLNDWGRYQFNAVTSRGTKIYDLKGNVKTEIDVLVSSPQVLVAVEVKIEPAEKHVLHHRRRLEILREYNDSMQDRRKILGAVAGAIFPQDVKEHVLEAGMFVIEQSGDTMKLSIPEDFSPAEW